MKQVRMDIIAALEKEKARIENQRGAWGGHDAQTVETIGEMLAKLNGDRPCWLQIERELRPWEIKL